MKSRYFFIAAWLAVMLGISTIIVNQQTAGGIANNLLKRDSQGFDTIANQQQLASYVSHHMGIYRTIFLGGSYSRAREAAAAAAAPISNGAVYAQAQASCAGHADSITQAHCVQSYLSSHSNPQANPQPIKLPVAAAYTKTYASPGWTPDLAGISIVAALALAAMGGYLMLLRR